MMAGERNVTITVSRQMGSLGLEIGQAVAKKLGYRLAYRNLINQAAVRCGLPEMALAAIDELKLLKICPSPESCQAYRQSLADVIREMSSEGQVVIVSRAAQVILQDQPGTLHVKVVAPREARARRTAELRGVTLEAALAQVDASDRFRKRFLNRFYQVKWDDPDLYDLVLNTARVPLEDAVAVVCAAAQNLKVRT